MNYRLPRSLINIIAIIALIWSSVWYVPLAAAAAALTITPTTWDVLGLDSNKVTDGPNTYMVGARVCNTGSTAATNVVSNFIWDTANTYVNLSGASSLSIAALNAGACTDFYYNILITRNSAAYNSTRGYHITATADTLATISTPTPRQLFVEKLVSQNRNAVASVSGATSVIVGQTYQYVVNSSTAPGGYEQLEAFLNFPNVMFQLISVSATYTSPTGGTNDKVYANACGWDPVPTSPNYRSCIGPAQYTGGKAGGTMVTTYNVKILSAGTATLTTLIYDFSGSSYHYNSDFGVGVNLITVTATNPSPPVANNDSTTTTGTTPATLTPATNDTASSGTTLAPGTIDLDPAAGQQTTRTTAEGAWTLDTATGTVTFTPVAGFVGTATIPYTIQNNAGQTSNPANLTVTVSAPSAPTATNDSTTTTGTAPATLTPAANDTAGGNGATLVPSTIDLDPATAGQQTTRTTPQGSWVLNTGTGQVTFTAVAGYTGTASIPYTIKDNYGTTSNQATLSVTVGGPAAPTANDDSATTTGTTPALLTPATNDTAGGNGATLVAGTIDLDPAVAGQQITRTTAQGGWVLDTTNGQVTFAPAAGFVGTASIPYTIKDSYGQTSNQANLSVTVSVPAAPTANNDSTTTIGTTPATLMPVTNDTAGTGATLVAGTIDLDPATPGQQTTRATGQGGWVLNTTNGQVTFTSTAGFVGTASIPYIIKDSYGQSSNVAILSVTVSAPAAPTANDDSTTTTGTTPATLVPASNDTAGGNGAALVPSTIDLDPATLGQQTTLTVAGSGTWTLDTTTGQVTFFPVVGLTGTATIPYTIRDNYGTSSNQANLSVTIGLPPAPAANDDSTITTGINPVTLVPAANDTAGGNATLAPGTIDLDPTTLGQQTTLSVAGQGSWVLDPTTGQVTFAAVAGFTGSATIPYTIEDNYGQTSNQANLTVTVSAPPAAPTANPDSTTTTGTTPALLDPVVNDQASGVGVTLDFSTIDLNPATLVQDTTLTVVGEGSWTLNTTTGQVTFAPVAPFVGTASIPYTIDDSNGLTSNQANLSVTVSAPAAPTANDDSTTTTGTTPATLIPATNDTPDGNGATLVPSTIDLDPATAGQQTTRATVEGGWVLDTTTGQVTFTPAAGFVGTASILYTIEDSYFQTSNVAILSVTVSAPAAPTANNDSTSTTGTNPATLTPATNDTAGGNGAALVASTIDLDPATLGQQTTLTDAGKGIWALDTASGNVTFLPVAGFNGTATIPYTIRDNYGTTSNPANLSVLVGVPAPPTANDDSTTTTGTTPATLTPASNDTIGGSGVTLLPGTIDLDPATVGQQATLTTAQGTWTLDTTTGTVTFTPAVGFVGTATNPYTIKDSVGQTSNPANLTVTVSAPAAPTANNDSTTTTGTTPALLNPTTNDTAGGNGATLVPSTIDLDPAIAGQQTTLTTAQGTWTLNTTTGTVTFTPVAGFTGTTVIPYTIKDNYGTTSNPANLTVTVGLPAAPTANDDSATTTGTTPALLPPATNDTAGGNGATLVPSTIDLDPATAGQQTTLSVAGEGVWTLNTTTGQVAFSSVTGFIGLVSIPYTIKDNYGTTSNPANLTVTVSAPAAPTANDDSTTTTGTNPVTLVPVANDTAGGNGAVLVSSTIDLDPATVGQQTTLTTAQGTWTLDTTNGTVSFTPALGFVGTASIPYTIQDNYGTISNPANLSVVVSTPGGLTANPDSTTTIGTTPVTLTPAANDAAGGNGATLVPGTIDLDTATVGQQTTLTTAQGTWTLDATNGTVTFTPAVGFVGTATVPYTIRDNYGTTSNQANLSVTVSAPAAPTANNDSTTTTGTTPALLNPTTNDTAGGNGAVLVSSTIDLDPATVGQQTTLTTAQGTWTLDTTTGLVSLTPVAGFTGATVIPYTIKDNYGTTSNLANLTVTVSAPAAPTANDDSTSTTGTTPALLTLATNDTAGGAGAALAPSTIDLDPATPGQQTTLTTAQGTWTLDTTTGQVAFLPVTGFIGTTMIPYTIQDNYGTTSNPANLTVTVSAPAAPTANDDSTTTTGTNPVTLVPVANDTAGGNGAVLVSSTIDLDPATVGQQTTLTTAQGTWTLDTTNGTVSFTPALGFVGTASIPYTIQDNYGTISNQANLSVVVSTPGGLTANPDSTTTIGTTPVTLTPAANDAAGGNGATLAPSTIDLDPTTPGQQTTLTTAQGTWTLDTTTSMVTFTPAVGFVGTATVPYTIQDNYGTTSNQANLSVTVSTPTAPTANNDSTTTTGTAPVTLTPVTNDGAGGNGAVLVASTIDLDPATPGQQTTIITTQGTWTLDTTNGQVTFIPAPGFSGTATLPYTVQNNYGQTSPSAILSVTVIRPTAIALASFTATGGGDKIVVRWVTTAELNTWGFQLYRSTNGKRTSAVRVTPALISGQGRGQGGASYTWFDASVEVGMTYTYWLQEVELNGVTNEYGPASATAVVSANVHVYLPFMRR